MFYNRPKGWFTRGSASAATCVGQLLQNNVKFSNFLVAMQILSAQRPVWMGLKIVGLQKHVTLNSGGPNQHHSS